MPAASRINSVSLTPSTVSRSVTEKAPLVKVPVLSSRITCKREIFSRAEAFLKRTPEERPTELPTIIAVGVARPRAQGQAITRTAIAILKANRKPAPVKTYQTRKVMREIHTTTGTNQLDTASANRWIGALSPWASSTMRTICESTVSLPTLVASTISLPLILMVAPVTSAPEVFSTGRDSPVTKASSTAEEPSTTMPSTGIFSPGRTTTRSPTLIWLAGTSTSLSSTRRRARSACKLSKDFSA